MTGSVVVEDRFATAFDEIRRLGSTADDRAAVDLTEWIAEQTGDRGVAARALMLKVGFLHNLGRVEECPAVLDRAFGLLDGLTEHGVLGGLHAMAGIVAASSSMGRELLHLVRGARELELETCPDREIVDAWYNLAVAFSYRGYHDQAAVMAERAYRLAQWLGLPLPDHALPEVAVRRAVAADHTGDTTRCAGLLREVVDTWSHRIDPRGMWRVERCYFAYATVRLAALGHDTGVRPELLDVEADGWEVTDLRVLGSACNAITSGRPPEALELMEEHEVSAHALGAAEKFRVRGLAHAAAGDYRRASEENRRAALLACTARDDLREMLVMGVRAKLDEETLRRSVERHASEALTDPLTGLPNRRHFDRWLGEVRGHVAVVGVIDLDDFKAVNTVHGHAGGDLVLQRVAAVLARTVRPGDFVCRFGGDEFVVALPDTDLVTAEALGDRIRRAVAGEDWQALVAGTPVSVTVGWAERTDDESPADSLDLADGVMLGRKSLRPRPSA